MSVAPDPQSVAKGVALGIATVFISSTVAATGKHLAGEVDIATIVLAQYAISFLLVLPRLRREGRAGLATSHPWLHAARSVSGVACFYTYYLALAHIPLVDATLLRNTAPLMVPLLVWAWLGIPVRRGQWLPLVAGFTGIVLILRPGTGQYSAWDLVALASAAGLAVSMVTTRELALTEPGSRILFYYFTVSLVTVLPFWAVHIEPVPVNALPWLIYMGVAMYLTFEIYTLAYRLAPASTVAPTSYFSVLFTGLLGWWIWGHTPDAVAVAGMALVVVSGLTILLRRPR